MLLPTLVKKLLEHFMKKICKKTNRKEFMTEIKKKGDKLYVKWKGHIIQLIVGLIKKKLNEILLYKNESIFS